MPEGRRPLTGIERQLLEERLATDRAAALERAESERRAALLAAEAATLAAPAIEESAGPTASAARERRRASWRRPAWLARRRPAAPATGDVTAMTAPIVAAEAVAAAPPMPAPEPEPIAVPEPAPEWVPEVSEPAAVAAVAEPVAVGAVAQPVATDALPAERPSRLPRLKVRDGQWLAFGLALTPVIGAGAIWLIASMRGELALSVEELRPIALALLAIGPAGALAALAARAWYPRLQGLVTLTALTGLVLVGRVLLG